MLMPSCRRWPTALVRLARSLPAQQAQQKRAGQARKGFNKVQLQVAKAGLGITSKHSPAQHCSQLFE
jgi:hypothetical protein